VNACVLSVGIAESDIRLPRSNTTVMESQISYSLSTVGQVISGGERLVSADEMPESFVIDPGLYDQDNRRRLAFFSDDEVVVTLDCSAHTVRFETPVIDLTLSIDARYHGREHFWALTVLLICSETVAGEVDLLPATGRCGFCLDRFHPSFELKQPRLLCCAHSFCFGCLQRAFTRLPYEGVL